MKPPMTHHLLRLLPLAAIAVLLLLPDSAQAQGWERLPGEARDIAAGPEGSVWIIGENEAPHRWNESAHRWEPQQGSGRKVAVDSAGTVVRPDGFDERARRAEQGRPAVGISHIPHGLWVRADASADAVAELPSIDG